MQNHLDQAAHNHNFHENIEVNFKDRFFDWKITVLFYTALHYVRAVASKKGIEIGCTHNEIASNIDPRRNGKMKFGQQAYKDYRALHVYSQTARYDGITDFATFEKLKQIDHSFCLQHLKDLKVYIKSLGVPVDTQLPAATPQPVEEEKPSQS